MSEIPKPHEVQEAPKQQETLDQTLKRLTHLIDDRPSVVRIPGTDPKEFMDRTISRAAQFQTEYAVESNVMTKERREKINEWIEADMGKEGKHELEKLAKTCIDFWRSIHREGLPGHDKRHLLEDLKAALRARVDLTQNGGQDHFGSAALIGSFMHDSGRLAEERVHGTPTGGEMGNAHAQMSFALTQDIVEHFKDIPQELRDQIVHSVLNHQTWPNAELQEKEPIKSKLITDEDMPRAVMGADRLQLRGPEALHRVLGFDVGVSEPPRDIAVTLDNEKKVKINTPGRSTNYFETLEFYTRNLMPVDIPGTPAEVRAKAQQRLQDHQTISAQFLWISLSDEARRQAFHPEMTKDAGGEINTDELAKGNKTVLPDVVWGSVKALGENGEGIPDALKKRMQDELGYRKLEGLQNLDDAVLNSFMTILSRRMLSPKHAATNDKEFQVIADKLKAVKGKQDKARLITGMAFAIATREAYDESNMQMVEGIVKNKEKYPDHSLERVFAQFIKSQG